MVKKINVSHILLTYEYEAKDILRALKEGKSFEDLAQKYSKCSSAENGGNLGDVPLSRLDSDFAEAAMALAKDSVTKVPIRTKFGYHIIKRNK